MRSGSLVRLLFVLSAALASAGGASAGEPEQHIDPRSRQVEALLAEWVDADGPGAAAAVVSHGRTLFMGTRGLANLEYGIPVTPATRFNLGSIAKQFTAFAVTLLVHRGELSLNDDIRRYVPEVPDLGARITIRHLLTHTSGLRDYYDLWILSGFVDGDILTSEQILKFVSRQRGMNFAPGERWQYCNTGYALLAKVVERVTGESLRVWSEENIFGPLGMRSTGFRDNYREILENRAYSYLTHGDGYENAVLNWENAGSTNLLSTVEDMAIWVRNFDEHRVGDKAVMEQMDEVGVLNDGESTGYAFGQFVGEYRGLKTISHSGRLAGFKSYVIRFPEEKLAVIVMSNVDYFDPVGAGKRIADIYLPDDRRDAAMDAVDEPDADAGSLSRVPVHVDRAALDVLAGSYQLESGKLLGVSREGDHLVLANLSTEPLVMQPASETRFFNENLAPEIEFELDSGGKPRRLVLCIREARIPAERVELPDLSDEQLRAFAGTYYSDELDARYSLVVRGGALVATHSRHPDTALTPTGESEFSGDNQWLRKLEFERDGQGRVKGFRVSSLGSQGLLFQRIERPR